MTDSEFDAWLAGVERLCQAKHLACPDQATLEFMYDDGLEPEEAASPAARARYCARPQRNLGQGAADLTAERLHQPD